MVAPEWGLTTDEHERAPGSNFNEIAFRIRTIPTQTGCCSHAHWAQPGCQNRPGSHHAVKPATIQNAARNAGRRMIDKSDASSTLSASERPLGRGRLLRRSSAP